jgi:hemerythrin
MGTATSVLIPWTDAYSVKVGIIDSQHKTLVNLINDLHQAMMKRAGKEQMGKVIGELLKYTKNHFTAEENLLRSRAYPELKIQEAEHASFVQAITDFQKKFQNNELGLTLQMMDFLKDWLSHHILVVDMKYSAFLNAKGVR